MINLSSVDGSVGIAGNSLLTNWMRPKLSTISGGLRVFSNDLLDNVDGLVNLSSVGGPLEFYDNTTLGACQGIAVLLGWPTGPPLDSVSSTIYIDGNDTGCGTVQEILETVAGPTQASITSAEIDQDNGISLVLR